MNKELRSNLNINYCKTARKKGCNREKVRLDMYRCDNGFYIGVDQKFGTAEQWFNDTQDHSLSEYISRSCDLTDALIAAQEQRGTI